MKALSIRAPWWYYILHHGKDVENRDWSTKFRGRVLIHASKWWKMAEVGEDLEICDDIAGTAHKQNPTTFLAIGLGRGCIVGSVEIVDCISDNHTLRSPWFFGDYGFVLKNPVVFAKPEPCKGALGFFDVPSEREP